MQLKQTLDSLNNFLPETTIIITLLVCLIADLLFNKKSLVVSLLAIAGLLITSYFVSMQIGVKLSIFSGMVVIDGYSVFFKFLFILSTIFVIAFAYVSKEIKNSDHNNEHLVLMLALILGAFLMSSSINLLMMYLSLELVSISSYVLAGYIKKVKNSSEAAMKYVIYGAASSGIMIYAMSLLYGFTGSMNIFEIGKFLTVSNAGSNPIMIISIVMILAGFGYKISSVPFHFWTPDVYEGSPIPITAFLAVTSSASGFAVLIRFFSITFLKSYEAINGNWQIIEGIRWTEILIVISVASMIIGNFVAIWQTSLRRLLAYSSIAQTGYILLGLVVANQSVLKAMLYTLSHIYL